MLPRMGIPQRNGTFLNSFKLLDSAGIRTCYLIYLVILRKIPFEDTLLKKKNPISKQLVTQQQMPVPRVRKIYYLIETAVWFLFICVKFHCALPGSPHGKSSAQRVHWSQPHTFTGPPKWHSRFGMRQTYQTVFTFQTWNSGLTNAVERPHPTAFLYEWKCLQKEMCQKALQKLSQKLNVPPRLSNELVILALYFWLLPISRRRAILRVSNDWLLAFSTNPKINF